MNVSDLYWYFKNYECVKGFNVIILLGVETVMAGILIHIWSDE